MKYLLIGLILFSLYSFWQRLQRPSEYLEKDIKNSKLEVQKVSTKLSGINKENKSSMDWPSISEIQHTKNPENKTNMNVAVRSNDDNLLSTLSDSGINLDEISEAMNSIEQAEELDKDQYYQELVSFLPPKTREIMEDLIEKKMINSYQLKDFFDKYVGRGMYSSSNEPRRYPGLDSETAQEEEFLDSEY